jgi:phage gp29-like protein
MARTPVIIDQYGNPVRPTQRPLARAEFAAPTSDGFRPVWSETVLTGLDPVGMAEVLRQAARGYPDRFFILAEEMEERDMHYRSVLSTRKLAITGVEPMVVAASEDARDQKIAEAVREIVEAPQFTDDYLSDLLDALSKGYSLVETIWDRQGFEWYPAAYKWRDPRHFVIDQVDGRTLRMKDGMSMSGVDLPPFVFSIHRPKLKSGLPVRGGLARLAAWAFLFKSYTLKDWMAFLEVYGMPLRVGKFGRGSSLDDRRVLLEAVRDISTDAAAIIPKEMEIEFVEVSGGTGNGLFSAKAEYLDKQVSKGVLGQTMSTDDGASLSQAQVHENVRHDIARADARQLAATANRDLIRPFVDFNFGPQEKYPTLVIPITEAEDIKALSEVIAKLVPLGLELSMPKTRERLGFEDPDEDDVLLKAPAAPKPTVNDPDDGDDGEADPKKRAGKKKPKPGEEDAATARLQPRCPHCGGFHAIAAEEAGERDELDLLVEEALSDWQTDLAPMFDPIRDVIMRSSSYDELIAGLDRLPPAATAAARTAIVERVAMLMMKARGLGDTGKGR